MTKREKELLRLLAEAYAFILDVRRVAINLASPIFIKKTEGIEEKIEEVKREYPRAFSQYLNKADRRAKEDKNGKKEAKVLQEKAGGDKGKARFKEERKEVQKKENQ